MNKHLFKKIYKILLKKHKSVYLNQDHSLTPPSQFSKARTPLQTGAVKCTGLLSLQPQVGGLLFREKRMPAFFILPPATSPEAKFQVSVVIGGVSAFFCPALLVKWRLYFGFSATANTGSLISLFRYLRS